MKNNQETIYQYISIQHDITEQKKLEQSLVLAKEQAELSSLAKAQFLANMSHEIRTPMNGILGMVNLLIGSEKDPDQLEKLKIVHSCSLTLLSLLNDILDISKIEANKIEIERQPLNLDQTIKDLVDLLNPRASEQGITLSYKSSADVPKWIIGDITRLRQNLTNLTSNAIKFTKQGGVQISSKANLIEENKWNIQFSIKDSGIGISTEAIKNLFQSFTQADSSITRRFGGAGLGLAISKGLCEKMGGSIWVESEEGKGSTFHFNFLATETSHQNLNTNPFLIFDSNLGKNYPLKILVAEDNKTNQLVISGILSKLGYKAQIVSNGKEAVAALETETYDIILMDCHMPEMDGFEATRQIKSIWKDKSPMIFALTASTMREDIDQCMSLGMNGVIPKPITIPPLAKVLVECYQHLAFM